MNEKKHFREHWLENSIIYKIRDIGTKIRTKEAIDKLKRSNATRQYVIFIQIQTKFLDNFSELINLVYVVIQCDLLTFAPKRKK